MDSSNTARNSVPGKPFTKGDPRINRKGRPKSFDALRELAQQIAHEEAKQGERIIIINGHRVTTAEMILRSWATSKNPILQKAFVEIAFGKVPDNIDLTSKGESIVLDGKQYDRAILTLADAVREKVPGTNGGSNGSVGSAE